MYRRRNLFSRSYIQATGILLLSLIFLTSCATPPNYRDLRIENAKTHFGKIKERTYAETQLLTLTHAIELAIANNLDIRVKDLQKAIAEERSTAAKLGMLPSMDLSAGYSSRDNEPGSSSISLESGRESLEASKSSEEDETRLEFNMLFSVLDFGLSYYSSAQHDDKAKIVEQQKRRTAQNLILDVTEAYLKVAAAQHAMTDTEDMIGLSKDTETALESAGQQGSFPPLLMFRERVMFLKLKKQLNEYRRNFENSKIKLCALLGYYPEGNIRVDTSFLQTLNEPSMPTVEELEQMALKNRPELSQMDMKGHISSLEAKKAILKMFPNVKLFADFTDTSNVYLYNSSWWSVGVKAAFDLLNLPGRYYEYRADVLEGEKIDLQTLALSIGIIAEVRIAHANLGEVKKRFTISDDIYNTQQEYLSTAKEHVKDGGTIKPLMVRRVQMETATAAIQRTTALASYYLAYHRLLNTVGRQTLEPEVEKPAPQPVAVKEEEPAPQPAAVKEVEPAPEKEIKPEPVVSQPVEAKVEVKTVAPPVAEKPPAKAKKSLGSDWDSASSEKIIRTKLIKDPEEKKGYLGPLN